MEHLLGMDPKPYSVQHIEAGKERGRKEGEMEVGREGDREGRGREEGKEGKKTEGTGQGEGQWKGGERRTEGGGRFLFLQLGNPRLLSQQMQRAPAQN